MDIAKALHTVHISGYLHNDIKLDNVVVRGSEESIVPVLIDFNKACRISHGKKYNLDEESRKEYRKLHRHIAPELVDGSHVQSTQSDIYSYAYMLKQISDCGYHSPQLKRVIKYCFLPRWHLRSSITKICFELQTNLA